MPTDGQQAQQVARENAATRHHSPASTDQFSFRHKHDCPSSPSGGPQKDCVHTGAWPSDKPHLELPFVIELFCGTARVTAALNHLGLQHSFGVDHVRKTAAPVKEVDLTSIEGAALLHAWVQSPYLAGIHAAPPCGTCSRAREIPVWGPEGQNVGPPPLRSAEYPEGLPSLRGANRERVSQANILYENLAECIRWVRCHKPQVMIVVENPANSWFWHTRFWKSVGHHFVLHYHSR